MKKQSTQWMQRGLSAASALFLGMMLSQTAVAANISDKPLFLTSDGLPPNVLLILDTSESMQEDTQGRLAQGYFDANGEQCEPGPAAPDCQWLVGAAAPSSKASGVKDAASTVIDEFGGEVNLGLMSYQQYPAGDVRDDVFPTQTDDLRTVRWRSAERLVDVRYSTNPNPDFYDPAPDRDDFPNDQAYEDALDDWDAPFWSDDRKQFRLAHPDRDNFYMFFNAGVPGFGWDADADGTSGVPQTDRFEFFRATGGSLENEDGVEVAFTHNRFDDIRQQASQNPVDDGSGLFYHDASGTFNVFLVDTLRQRGIQNWGDRIAFYPMNQLEWRATESPGLGYLHVPLGGLELDEDLRPILDDDFNPVVVEDHLDDIRNKLEPQRHDWNPNAMTDAEWPLISAGLTPIEGTMRTVRDYFLGDDDHFEVEQGNSNLPPIPESCFNDFAIWVTDGLPSVNYRGEGLGDDPVEAMRRAGQAIENLYLDTRDVYRDLAPDDYDPPEGVRTYVVGYSMPSGVEREFENDDELSEYGSDILDFLAEKGRVPTGKHYPAESSAEVAEAIRTIIRDNQRRDASSAAAVAANSTSLQTDTAIFQAGFNSTNWSGSVDAIRVGDGGELESDPAWRASDRLPAYQNRNIRTWVPSGDDPDDGNTRDFAWGQNPGQMQLSEQQQQYLIGSGELADENDAIGEWRLNWLRGDKTHSVRNEEGVFRSRVLEFENEPEQITLLGDIVHSAPLFVSAQNFGYQGLSSGGASYSGALAEWADQDPLVFVAANDGKLHAFNGSLEGASRGREEFAIIPNAVYRHFEDIADPNWEDDRRYVFDGSPRLGHAYDGSNWRRIVVTTLGRGGAGAIAVDADTGNVLWELDDSHSNNLGAAIGDPAMVKSDDGWVTLIPNGVGSGQGASLLVVDTFTGEIIRELRPENHNPDDNAMFSPVPIDSNGDRRVDRVYAGDLSGNLWRVNMDGSSANWGFAFGGDPLFQARGPDDNIQPITSRPAVALDDDGRVNVFFGTGKYFEDNDHIAGPGPVQSLYGIQDRDDGQPVGSREDSLLEQEILHELINYEFDSGDSFDLRVTSDNELQAGHHGWYMDLVSPLSGRQAERVFENAIVRGGDRIVFATMIPEDNDDPCLPGSGTGWIMEFDAFTGGRLERSPWDLSGEGFGEDSFVDIDNPDGSGSISVPAHGIRSPVGIPTTPTVIEDGDREYKLPVGSEGEVWEMPDEERTDSDGRQSWQQVR